MATSRSRDVAVGALVGSGISTLATLALVRRYISQELQPPKLIHGEEPDGPEARQLLLEVQLLLRDYWPHPFLEFSGYASTVWSGLWVALLVQRKHPGRLETLKLKDGGTVSLCWAEPPAGAEHKWIALVFPGLCNDSRTHYIRSAMDHLRAEGFQAVTFNYRGTGGVELTSPRMGTFDSWRDVPEVLEHIRSQCSGHELFGVGFSMGGGILLRHLGETGSSCGLRAAVTVAAVTDLVSVAEYLSNSPKKLLVNFIMAQGMKAMAIVNGIYRSQHFRPFASKFFRAMTLGQVDEVLHVPMHGYRSAHEFRRVNSAHTAMHGIVVPTLMLNSQDDPVVGYQTIAMDEIKANPHIYLALTRRGGHLGWSTGGHSDVVCWADRMTAHFLKSCASGRTVVDIAHDDEPSYIDAAPLHSPGHPYGGADTNPAGSFGGPGLDVATAAKRKVVPTLAHRSRL